MLKTLTLIMEPDTEYSAKFVVEFDTKNKAKFVVEFDMKHTVHEQQLMMLGTISDYLIKRHRASRYGLISCDYPGCTYEGYKSYMKHHMLVHDPSTLNNYICCHEGCNYRTRYCGNMVRHEKLHKR